MSDVPHTEGTPAISTLATETSNPATADIDRMSPLEVVQALNAEDAKVARAVELVLPEVARAIEAIADRMSQGGRLIYIGAGTSGRLGILDASECPPTFGTSPEQIVGLIAGGPIATASAVEDAEDNPAAGRAELEHLRLTELDTVVGIAASGRTPYVLGAIEYAKNQGALTIGLACNQHSPLERRVEIAIVPLVGPEAITGSTRLKSGTAQKMVLNMLSTGTMVLLGKTYGNLMVDVVATNYKLEQRASSIVQQATGLDRAQAVALLRSTQGETKTAIVVGRLHVSPDVARAQLAAHNHNLRNTLEAMQS
ncbi:N-acetylmuramic acid 6-phosphate etherase [Dictyobacter aurantiacus]|uniref:N-acetylmuramic acid 6-phosphate etherase n=1 Tax=Dictyobacter aurantiacus TaxID=1936993 RepID=A0A401ZEG1_9CHLR|nr:N-acetylmuramic acid 6-phosphate etherase [Dictyobacter aurantiacus]GCE05255.1 N-acetylmuramic acid 6-phosphate etherase [Dictyobacter aurantiacus]